MMARPTELIPGNCYFSLGFYDRDLLLPMIDTLVFVGHEDDAEHGRTWLFKEPESGANIDGTAESTDPQALHAFTDRQLHEILDFPALLRTLRAIAADHNNKRPSLTASAATHEEFGSLRSEIAKFLNDSECASLTVTIRFTSDALSLSRGERGCEMHFFMRPRVDPDRDTKILALFVAVGLQPNADYLSDRGRTRVLAFPMECELDVIEQLCRRVLTEVYSMREGDALDYRALGKSDM